MSVVLLMIVRCRRSSSTCCSRSTLTAVTLMLTAIYVKQPVEFSVSCPYSLAHPDRLASTSASTRLILMNGAEGVDAAGHVIKAFGEFVVGGSFIVGVVIFLVLIAIQFLVINHGAVRISEVTARFTLDAMPGRQMAIDADLNAGVIDEKQARFRRERVRREADFYGSMDGAIRFTQRDAMAAILITAVNIVAGLIIGVVQHDMEIGTAAETYTLLTVGEGLVTAIPALLVSMSGALITTRAASESHLGEEVATQLFARSRPLGVAAGVLLGLGLIPGMPKTPFFIIAALLGAAAYANRNEVDKPSLASAENASDDPATAAPSPDAIESVVSVDPLGVEVGYALVSIVDEKQGGTLLSRVRAIRRQIAGETGLVVPSVRVTDNLQRGPRTYGILVRGVEVARGELFTDRLLAVNPGTAATVSSKAPPRVNRPLVCPRCGSAPISAMPRCAPASPWSIRPPRSRRISPKSFATSCPTCSRASRRKNCSTAWRRPPRSSSKSWCPSSPRSATYSACCGNCCVSACRFAISRPSSKPWPTSRPPRRILTPSPKRCARARASHLPGYQTTMAICA
jgi:flagellar biosynthesis protein FlhA